MASHAPDFGRASALPLSAVIGAIPSFPRPVIQRLVTRMIEHLDEQDGDPDLEDGEGQLPWSDDRGRWLRNVDFPTEDDEPDDPPECNGDPEPYLGWAA
jgi:hypothetical protein